MNDLRKSDANDGLIDDDLSNRILRTLESLSQPNRIRYVLWVVERLLPSYVNLAEDMDWEVDATIELIHHALSDRIDDEEPDLDDIVSLVEQLPEGAKDAHPTGRMDSTTCVHSMRSA